MGYTPYENDTIAGFTPAQESAMASANQFAKAFGLDGSAGVGLPDTSVDNPYGIHGYSSYEAMGAIDPEVQAGLDAFYEKASKKTPYQGQPSVSGGKK